MANAQKCSLIRRQSASPIKALQHAIRLNGAVKQFPESNSAMIKRNGSVTGRHVVFDVWLSKHSQHTNIEVGFQRDGIPVASQ